MFLATASDIGLEMLAAADWAAFSAGAWQAVEGRQAAKLGCEALGVFVGELEDDGVVR
jgi:hypothetical protein